MNNIDLAISLLLEAKAEKARFLEMNEKLNKALKKPDYSWKDRLDIEMQYNPIPKKAVVNDCIKMARRLLMKERLL